MNKIFLLLCLFTASTCVADRYIQPVKYEKQKDIFVQGGVVTLSEKENAVLMFQTSSTLKKNRANFHFTIENNAEAPINFLFQNLRVEDQMGRAVRVIHKQELISNKKSASNWKYFGSFVASIFDHSSANNAGTIGYASTSRIQTPPRQRNGHVAVGGRNVSKTTTYATIHSEAARQHALQAAGRRENRRNRAIHYEFKSWEQGLNDNYFDSMTIFPGGDYSANFQIDVPKPIEKELQYLVFHYDLGGEEHTFCYYTGPLR